MSRIGYKPIPVPQGVEVRIGDGAISVKGPRGTLDQTFEPSISIVREDSQLKVDRASDEPQDRALHGLTRSLVSNMITGVTDGYTRTLDLVGVGYRVQQSGRGISLSLMFSHPVIVEPAPGITLEVEGNNRIHVRGADKQAVGQQAAQIRAIRPPNVYTGKGVRYAGEQIRLKPGKSARRA